MAKAELEGIDSRINQTYEEIIKQNERNTLEENTVVKKTMRNHHMKSKQEAYTLSHSPAKEYYAEDAYVCQPYDKFTLKDKFEIYNEIIKGKFDLNINHNLPMSE